MGWRTVIVESTAKLDYKMGYLVIRSNEEIKRIHISEISVLVLETTSISLTAYLLCELANEKISVIFCDQKRNPHGQYLPLYGNHNTSDKIRKQILWTDDIKRETWRVIVTQKILGQAVMLKKIGEKTEAEKLISYIPQIEPGDMTNREGHAAKVYFNRLFGKDFSRTDKESVINAQLNYGYSILLSVVNREVVANGYLTQVGIHHDNMFNYFNLSCDIMEPFRPFIDQAVIELEHNEFGKNEKHHLVSVLNNKVFIGNKEQYFINAISIYVKNVLDSIESNDPSIIHFPDYELSLYESNCNV